LSNLNRFSNVLDCWGAYEIYYKNYTTSRAYDTIHLTLGMLLHNPGELKIQTFLKHSVVTLVWRFFCTDFDLRIRTWPRCSEPVATYTKTDVSRSRL